MATRDRFNRFFQVGINVRILQNRSRVHAYIIVNHKFQTRQTHTCIRQLTKIKRQLWIANVHHDFCTDVRHLATINFGDFGLKNAIINFALIALSAGHGHQRAVF